MIFLKRTLVVLGYRFQSFVLRYDYRTTIMMDLSVNDRKGDDGPSRIATDPRSCSTEYSSRSARPWLGPGTASRRIAFFTVPWMTISEWSSAHCRGGPGSPTPANTDVLITRCRTPNIIFIWSFIRCSFGYEENETYFSPLVWYILQVTILVNGCNNS